MRVILYGSDNFPLSRQATRRGRAGKRPAILDWPQVGRSEELHLSRSNGHNGSVLVSVDDARLLDDLSAFAVHQLITRRLATVSLTIRSGDTPPDTTTAIWKDRHLERLELQPLSLAEREVRS